MNFIVYNVENWYYDQFCPSQGNRKQSGWWELNTPIAWRKAWMVVEPTNFMPRLRRSAEMASEIDDVVDVWSRIGPLGQNPARYASNEPNSS